MEPPGTSQLSQGRYIMSRLLTNQGPDRSGSCLILIGQQPDRSGCHLILIWHVPDRSGSCLILIRQQPDRSACRLNLIWDVPDRSGSRLPFWCSEKKTESQAWGRNGLKKTESKKFLDSVFFSKLEKTESKKFLDSVFFQTISPHVWDSFFSELQKGKCNRYPFLQLFRTRVLGTH